MTTPSDNTLTLSGEFTIATVLRFLADGKERVTQGDLSVDFSAVTSADSAALAALFAWMREARQAGHHVFVHSLPEGVRSLAKLYGVETLLPASR